MIRFAFTLFLVGSLQQTEGVRHGECPLLPCPYTDFCKTTAPTFFLHNGMNCSGCDECIVSVPSKKAASGVTQFLHTCPMVLCTAPPPCDVPLQTNTMKFGDLVCPTCQFCPQGHEKGSSSGLIRLKKDETGFACPQVLCVTPTNHCPVPLQTTKMSFMGQECAGCPYCPTDRI